MRSSLLLAAMFIVGCNSGKVTPTPAAHDHAKHITVLPDKVDWKMNPASLPLGAKIALLEGDPSSTGFFTMRGWFPDGYKIPPHWHPGVERVTVISGMFYLGEGDTFDPSKATAYPPGSYTSMPPGMKHFAFAKGETVVQISTMGPWGITYLNSADDPRNAAAPPAGPKY